MKIAALLKVKIIPKAPKIKINVLISLLFNFFGIYNFLKKKRVRNVYANGRVEANGPIEDLNPILIRPS